MLQCTSRAGQAHHRALQTPSNTVQSFCGAGRVASILHRATKDGTNKLFEIIGVGLWHKEDTNTLASMLDPAEVKGQTPHRLTRPAVNSNAGGSNLINLADALSDNKVNPSGTTKVIRIYQHTGDKINLIQRIDWEVPLDKDMWGDNLGDFLDKRLTENKIDAVVIKDMCKGVVTRPIIRWLSERYGKLPWFVSTKAWCPDWFNDLKNIDVRLVLIPPVAAQLAIEQGKINNWITRSGRASKETLELAKEVYYQFSNKPIIVALPGGLTILAYNNDDKATEEVVLQAEKEPRHLAVETPMASVFFPALITNIMKEENKDIEKHLREALGFTKKWMSKDVGRVEKYEHWNPEEEPHINLSSPEIDTDIGKWSKKVWKEEIEGWRAAFDSGNIGVITNETSEKLLKLPAEVKFPEDLKDKICYNDFRQLLIFKGIMSKEEKDKLLKLSQDNQYNKAIEALFQRSHNEGKKCLELWRAMTDVKGYICCVKSKRMVLQKLIRELGSPDVKKKLRHKSCMLVAPPGSGKTFLVRCLAKTLGLRYLSFNITQMLSKKDILDCFDTIITTQAQNREEVMLVFIDEINAMLDGQHVYDTFLAPLEEGVYVRAEKTFPIDPCVWVFAGTESLTTDDPKRDKSTKASDLVSRLTIKPLSLQINTSTPTEQSENEARLEKVYLGVSLLQSLFPDVRKVSEKVLTLFHILNPTYEVREVEHFVKSFVNIQHSEVKSNNVPLGWLREHSEANHVYVTPLESWGRAEEGDMVEIKQEINSRQ